MSTAGLRVLVVGAAGYVGGELLRLLLAHPHVAQCTALSRSHAGQPLATAHPALYLLTQARFSTADLATLVGEHDVIMLALEHGDSAPLMPAILAADRKLVVDLSADFRIADQALYAQHYGPHPQPELLPRFVYGLADVVGAALHGARALASPGCFATAAQLALYPLRTLLGDVTPSLFAITGSSGGGSRRATAAGVVRQTRVNTSRLRKVKGKGGTIGASHGVEKPGVSMSATVTRSRPPLRRSLPLMTLQ